MEKLRFDEIKAFSLLPFRGQLRALAAMALGLDHHGCWMRGMALGRICSDGVERRLEVGALMEFARNMSRSLANPVLWLMGHLVVVMALLGVASIPGWAQLEVPNLDMPVRVAKPVTVEVWNRPIVVLRAAVGEYTPEERAATIRQRIEELPYDLLLDEVRAEPGNIGNLQGLLFMVGNRILFALLPQDVTPEFGKSLEQVGQETVGRLREVLRARYQQQRFPALLRAIEFSLGATLLFVVTGWGLFHLRSRFLRHVEVVTEKSPLSVAGYDIRPHLRSLLYWLIKAALLGAGLVAAYLWLTFVLVQFPYSEPWGHSLGAYLRSLLSDLSVNALKAVPGFFTVIIIFLLTRFVSRGVSSFFLSIEAGRMSVPWLEAETAKATRRLAVILIWIFAVTVAYPHIPGSDTAAFKGISVLLGLMVSFGSAGFVNQVMNGFVIVYSRILKRGEFVRVGEHYGVVSELGTLSTKILNHKQEEITIPNAVLVGTSVINYSRLAKDTGSVVATSVTIGYDTPWRQVHALLLLAAERSAGIRPEPPPYVLQLQLEDFYIEYQLLVHLERAEDRMRVLSGLHANIQDAFNEYAVQIMSPHFVSQPQEKVVVPEAQWYVPPAQKDP
jgi:small-conductance mechanosensitive channel